jgi:metal-responsive CopG/Arc/MetJ family transcriptional regulator
METIQVVLDQKLLRAADAAARRTRQNRLALIRDALRAHPRKLQIRALEDQERAAYSRQPASVEESLLWEREAAWPSE